MNIAWVIIFLQLFGVSNDDQPQFRGGGRSLTSFLVHNQIYPEYSKSNCIQGTIYVKFKLNHDGEVYDSEVQKGLGVDLDQEALRLIRLSSGEWSVPANHDTTKTIVLPVNFSLKEYDCEQRSPENISQAIMAYRTRTNLTKAVINFYQKKAAGEYIEGDESKIYELKAHLGYDEKYSKRLLKQAERKIKQKDIEGACEDLVLIRNLGSNIAEAMISRNCR